MTNAWVVNFLYFDLMLDLLSRISFIYFRMSQKTITLGLKSFELASLVFCLPAKSNLVVHAVRY